MIIASIALLTLQTNAETDRAMKAMTEQEAVLDAMDADVLALLTHANKLDASAVLRAEEAESLRLKYPDIKVSPSSTTKQLVAALRSEQSAQRERAIILANAAQYSACLTVKATEDGIRKMFASIQASEDWKRMALEDRIAMRKEVGTRLAEFDPAPCEEQVKAEPMNGEMMKE